jgi:hypothetical protein
MPHGLPIAIARAAHRDVRVKQLRTQPEDTTSDCDREKLQGLKST